MNNSKHLMKRRNDILIQCIVAEWVLNTFTLFRQYSTLVTAMVQTAQNVAQAQSSRVSIVVFVMEKIFKIKL